MIPPKANAEFAARMERVLSTYARPYDPEHPVVCMDEQPVQLVREAKEPISEAPGRPARVDYEYRRAGSASVFLFGEPLAGCRRATIRSQRTKVNFAQEVEDLLSTRYTDGERVTLLCDNLNTHTEGAFYEAFEPGKARALLDRIEFCYTSNHGSWLNVAECELSCMSRQCLNGRRIGDEDVLRAETRA